MRLPTVITIFTTPTQPRLLLLALIVSDPVAVLWPGFPPPAAETSNTLRFASVTNSEGFVVKDRLLRCCPDLLLPTVLVGVYTAQGGT